ncbi:hypothetical protein [Fodinicola feengrottensis]|uniref:hypothetical protein n=1 Tax=Fodinicola feengrottensis TaxID=435914 RepID=UPI002442038A|nr:hypothetical protein [Fodinicola feengrottensis]
MGQKRHSHDAARRRRRVRPGRGPAVASAGDAPEDLQADDLAVDLQVDDPQPGTAEASTGEASTVAAVTAVTADALDEPVTEPAAVPVPTQPHPKPAGPPAPGPTANRPPPVRRARPPTWAGRARHPGTDPGGDGWPAWPGRCRPHPAAGADRDAGSGCFTANRGGRGRRRA